MDNLTGMVRTDDRGPGAPEGWPIVDVTTVNNDPWQNDDCWHRGAYTIYILRGTNIREEQRSNDQIGDLYDRFMKRVKKAGYVGYVELIGTRSPYRVLHTTESY